MTCWLRSRKDQGMQWGVEAVSNVASSLTEKQIYWRRAFRTAHTPTPRCRRAACEWVDPDGMQKRNQGRLPSVGSDMSRHTSQRRLAGYIATTCDSGMTLSC